MPRKSKLPPPRDRLAALAGQHEQEPAAAEARPSIALGEPAIAAAVDRLCAANHADKAVYSHKTAARAVVLPFVRLEVLKAWVREGRRLENPRFVTPAGNSFILQCKDTLGGHTLKLPEELDKHLERNGIPKALVDRMKQAGEFAEMQTLTIDMPRLEKEAPNVAEKLIDLLLAAADGLTAADGRKFRFTSKELAMIVAKVDQAVLEEGFLDRCVDHVWAAAGDVDEAVRLLDRLLAALSPQWVVGQSFCANPDEGVIRLLKEDPPAAPTGAVARAT